MKDLNKKIKLVNFKETHKNSIINYNSTDDELGNAMKTNLKFNSINFIC
jgi:hypothetical protein